MESILPLGCILDKSPTTLRMTADPRERVFAALFCAALGLVPLLIVLFVPFSRLGWAGIIIFSAFGVVCLSLAFLIGFCSTEIEFDQSHGQIVHRHFCLGRVQSISVLPLNLLQTIGVVRKGKHSGELQLIQADGKVWAKWIFLTMEIAQETREEILAWLER